MQSIDDFAQAPQRSEGRYFKNNEIAPEVIKFIENESILRDFFVSKKMNGVLSKTFRIERDEGIAVQIAGNSEVPREENVRKIFTIYLHRNATGYAIDEDDRKINRDDPTYEQRKMEAALKRMVKKENKDMLDVMMSAAQVITTIPNVDKFDVAAVVKTVGDMIKNAKTGPYNMALEPDVILMPYAMFAELQTDPKFQFVPEIYQRILLDGKVKDGGNRGILYGDTGQVVAGLKIIVVNELENTAIIMDSQKEALWLAEDEEPMIVAYDDPEHIASIVDIRHDEQPVCVLPEALGAIKKAP